MNRSLLLHRKETLREEGNELKVDIARDCEREAIALMAIAAELRSSASVGKSMCPKIKMQYENARASRKLKYPKMIAHYKKVKQYQHDVELYNSLNLTFFKTI